MRIAIVEDQAQERERLASFVRRYFEEQGRNCQLTLFEDGDDMLETERPEWDLIFLDIQLQRLDGMKTAEMIRQRDKDVLIVFVTSMAHYAIKGYGVRALDFLLKPINYRMLEQVLMQAERLLRERQTKTITLPLQKGMVRLDVADIYYVEVESHILSVVTRNETLHLRGTISNIEEMLREDGFFRCNNCYLVNLAHVSRVERGTAVVGGHTLSISRPRQKKFMEALTRYIGGSEMRE